MYHIIFTMAALKVFRPYIRKNIFDTITNWEFIFLNSVFIMILSFFYAYVYKREDIKNICNLTCIQYTAAIFLAVITIVSTLAVFKLQETNIITSTFFVKSVSSIMLLIIGIFIYNEKITPIQMVGICLGTLALFLMK